MVPLERRNADSGQTSPYQTHVSTVTTTPGSARAGSDVPTDVPSLAAVMARSATENFPVAARVLPAAVRQHLQHIYGFARLTDQLGDAAAGDRLALLDWLDGEVDAIFAERVPSHAVMQRLVSTVRRYGIPHEPFRRLIEANRQDQRVTSYATFDELLGYCELSANPVGHLVLYVFEAATPERLWLADRVCTALQLVEHWQDVAEDWDNGRLYLPEDDLRRFGYAPEQIGARLVDDAFRDLLAFEVDRALALMAEGAPLIRLLPRRSAIAVAAFVEGGRAALRAIAKADYDVLTGSPRPSMAATATVALKLLRLVWAW